ncbi:oxygen-insensitive NADPH nitroreductase [Bacillaceae bacterium S4-13-58]
MNSTIEILLQHRSIRSFSSKQLTTEEIDQIVLSAQSASTSSYMQAYSIIGVTDKKKKKILAEITGQSYVENNGYLMIFCADLNRLTTTANQDDFEQLKPNLENTEHFLVASIDVALAAQNAAIAAESMNLGICYIGSIRNQIEKVGSLFNLPKHVIPLFGMVFGEPTEKPEKKPRLPMEAVFFENEYGNTSNAVQEFNEKAQKYYKQRSMNQRIDNWSDQMIRRLQKPIRMDVTDYIKKQGFNKR